MKKSVLIIGANGMLGTCVQDEMDTLSQYHTTATTRKDLDLSDRTSICAFFAEQRFDIIINCAAYTAVDGAESDLEVAEQVNHLAVAQLADIAKSQSSMLLHISTDYVFDGNSTRAYTEQDAPSPINVYGKTKAAGERAVMQAQGHALVIRTSWIYAEHGHNFVRTILRVAEEKEQLQVVNDQLGTPTYARGLAYAIRSVMLHPHSQNLKAQIYHYSDEGIVSWYDFAQAIVEIAGIECSVLPIASEEYPQAAPRPQRSILDKSKIQRDFGIEIFPWREQLAQCIGRAIR